MSEGVQRDSAQKCQIGDWCNWKAGDPDAPCMRVRTLRVRASLRDALAIQEPIPVHYPPDWFFEIGRLSDGVKTWKVWRRIK